MKRNVYVSIETKYRANSVKMIAILPNTDEVLDKIDEFEDFLKVNSEKIFLQ
jgi:hypothetical protein